MWQNLESGVYPHNPRQHSLAYRQFCYCWRSLKQAQFMFGADLKTRLISVRVPPKLTSPAVALLVKGDWVSSCGGPLSGWGIFPSVFRLDCGYLEDIPCGPGKGAQALTWHEAKCGGSVDIANFSSAICA
jgi:hypothetical protein